MFFCPIRIREEKVKRRSRYWLLGIVQLIVINQVISGIRHISILENQTMRNVTRGL